MRYLRCKHVMRTSMLFVNFKKLKQRYMPYLKCTKKMLDIAGSEECAYSQKCLEKKLEDKYSHHIRFVQSGENATKICLRNMVDYLVTEEWYNQRMSNAEDEVERIIKTAAKLIIENIRPVKFENEFYPAKESMGDVTANKEWLPPYL